MRGAALLAWGLTLSGCIGWGVPPEARRALEEDSHPEGDPDPLADGSDADGDPGDAGADADGDADGDEGDADPGGGDAGDGCPEGEQDDDGNGLCSPACSSTPTPACGGHGTCNDDGVDILCSCFIGYQFPTCTSCSLGYVWDGDSCEPSCSVKVGRDDCVAAACTDTPGGGVCGTCVLRVDVATPDLTPSGLSWDSAYPDLDSAISAQGLHGCSNSEIWVAGGVYHVRQTGPTDTIEVTAGTQVYGGFLGDETARDQRDPGQVETVLDGAARGDADSRVYHVITAQEGSRLDGFVVRHGRPEILGPIEGGGLLAHGSVTVAGCLFVDNEAPTGNGAAIADAGESGTITIQSSRFVGNVTGVYGGAVFADEMNVAIEDSTFSNNSAGASGGAVAVLGDRTLTITESHFVGNEAEYGGAVASGTSLTSIERTVFSANHGINGGGALFDSVGALRVVNTAFVANEAGGVGTARTGGAADLVGGAFVNCTFAGNDSHGGHGAAIFSSGGVVIANSLIKPATGPSDVRADVEVAIVRSLADFTRLVPAMDEATYEAPGNLTLTSGGWDAELLAPITPATALDTITAGPQGTFVLTDNEGGYTPAGGLVGRFVNGVQVIANTATQLTVIGGRFTPCTSCGLAYSIVDLHLSAVAVSIDHGGAGPFDVGGGQSVASPTVDLEGVTRASSSAGGGGADVSPVDIGAYERP